MDKFYGTVHYLEAQSFSGRPIHLVIGMGERITAKIANCDTSEKILTLFFFDSILKISLGFGGEEGLLIG